jgi:hypothetical protein
MNLLQACKDDALFAPWFARGDWGAWFAFIAAAFGLPMTKAQADVYTKLTGRVKQVKKAFQEIWVICGRRAGKSFITALIGAYLAAFRDYAPYLQPGERATVLILATDRKQARVIMRYLAAFFAEIPMLHAMVERSTEWQIDLTNNVSVEIATASFRSTRGYTLAAVLGDETAFWRSDESANPDTEILNALRPGMATIPGAMMLCIGSPYARKGAMYRAYRQYFGKDNAPVLVWKAPTRAMNPSVPQSIIDDAIAADEFAARAEWLAEFRTDIEMFVTREVIEQATRPAPLELPYNRKLKYVGFVDPAGGGADEFTLGIGHNEDTHACVDVLRARTGRPADIVADYAKVLKGYGVLTVYADRYAGSWPVDEFKIHGITVEPAEQPKSGLYLDTLAALNSGQVELPPDDRMTVQFISLERRTARGGRDSIDHPPGGHDDRANAVAGLVAHIRAKRGNVPLASWV